MRHRPSGRRGLESSQRPPQTSLPAQRRASHPPGAQLERVFYTPTSQHAAGFFTGQEMYFKEYKNYLCAAGWYVFFQPKNPAIKAVMQGGPMTEIDADKMIKKLEKAA